MITNHVENTALVWTIDWTLNVAMPYEDIFFKWRCGNTRKWFSLNLYQITHQTLSGALLDAALDLLIFLDNCRFFGAHCLLR